MKKQKRRTNRMAMNKKVSSVIALVAAISLIATGCKQTNEGGNNIPSLDEITITTTEATETLEAETTTTFEETTVTTEETTIVTEVPESETEYAPETITAVQEFEPAQTTAAQTQRAEEDNSSASSWTETSMDAEMYVTEKCYSRERAVIGSTPISQFFPGDVIQVVAITDTGYYKLSDGGFIHSDYVSDTKEETTVTTAATESEETKPRETTAKKDEDAPSATEAVDAPAVPATPSYSGPSAISGTGNYSVKSSSRYAYKQLSAKEQTLYNNIVDSVMNLESVVPIPEGMSKDDVVKVYTVVYNSEPQLFWMGSTLSAGTSFATLSFKTSDKNEIASMQKEIDKAAASILSKANGYSGTVSKLKVFYDTLVLQSEFSKSESGYNCSVYNGLTGKGNLQCAGYAKTMQYLCDMAGIEACVVVGTNSNGDSHAWNVVYCQNGYYNIDATWGDPINDFDSKYIQYEFFLVPDAWIHNKTHFNVNTSYRGNGNALYLYNPPSCTKEGCNYFAAYNKLYDTKESAETAYYAELDDAIANKRNIAEIRVSSKAVYDSLMSDAYFKTFQNYAKGKSSSVSKLKRQSSFTAGVYVVHYDIVYN